MGVASVTPHQSTPSMHIQPRPLCGNIMAARNEKQIKQTAVYRVKHNKQTTLFPAYYNNMARV